MDVLHGVALGGVHLLVVGDAGERHGEGWEERRRKLKLEIDRGVRNGVTRVVEEGGSDDGVELI